MNKQICKQIILFCNRLRLLLFLNKTTVRKIIFDSNPGLQAAICYLLLPENYDKIIAPLFTEIF